MGATPASRAVESHLAACSTCPAAAKPSTTAVYENTLGVTPAPSIMRSTSTARSGSAVRAKPAMTVV